MITLLMKDRILKREDKRISERNSSQILKGKHVKTPKILKESTILQVRKMIFHGYTRKQNN